MRRKNCGPVTEFIKKRRGMSWRVVGHSYQYFDWEGVMDLKRGKTVVPWWLRESLKVVMESKKYSNSPALTSESGK